MTKVNFYHLQKTNVEQALAKLLEKAYATKKNVLVRVGTDERVEFLNTALWTFDDTSFLPHGSKKDGNADKQPIWLTSGEDNPNEAKILFLVDDAKADVEEIGDFDIVCNLFDGGAETSMELARDFWRKIKGSEHECCYWQQDETGGWKQKA